MRMRVPQDERQKVGWDPGTRPVGTSVVLPPGWLDDDCMILFSKSIGAFYT